MTLSYDDLPGSISGSARSWRTRRFRKRRPAYKLLVDFGPETGVKRSSAQLTTHYRCDALIGRQVAAVVNFAPRQIGKFMSEVLVLGFPDDSGAVVLVGPERPVPNGGKLF